MRRCDSVSRRNQCVLDVILVWVLVFRLYFVPSIAQDTGDEFPGNLAVNISFLVENLNGGPMDPIESFFMYNTNVSEPFTINPPTDVYAEQGFLYNSEGVGPAEGRVDCEDEGAGAVTTSEMIAQNLGLNTPNRLEIGLVFDSFSLDQSSFEYINVATGAIEQPGSRTLGESGDMRNYTTPTLRIFNRTSRANLLVLKDVVMSSMYSYPSPAGPVPPLDDSNIGVVEIAVRLTGSIDYSRSLPLWVEAIDPGNSSFVNGYWTRISFSPRGCWSVYRTVEMIFYDFSERNTTDPNSGQESAGRINTSRSLGTAGLWVVTGFAAGSIGFAVISGLIAMVTGSTTGVSAHSGVVNMLQTAAYIGMINQIQGVTYSESWSAFAGQLDVFILRVPAPWGSSNVGGESTSRFVHRLLWKSIRQANDVDSGVEDYIVIGCGFYAGLMLLVLMISQISVFLIMRKRPLKAQLASRSFVNYITNAVLMFIFVASIIASVQYLSSDDKTASLTAIAVLMLVIVGIGIPAFMLIICYLAFQNIREKKIRYKYNDKMIRSAKGIRDEGVVRVTRRYFEAGTYKAKKGNTFHKLYAVFYEHINDVWIWLVGINVIFILIESTSTGGSADAVVPIAIILALHVILTGIVLYTKPFTDIIEGSLETTVLVLEIGIAVLAMISVFEDDADNRNTLGFVMVILAFVALILSIVVAGWADFYPLGKDTLRRIKKAWNKRFNPGNYYSSSDSDLSDEEKQAGGRAAMEEAVLQEMAMEDEIDVIGFKELKDLNESAAQGLELPDGDEAEIVDNDDQLEMDLSQPQAAKDNTEMSREGSAAGLPAVLAERLQSTADSIGSRSKSTMSTSAQQAIASGPSKKSVAFEKTSSQQGMTASESKRTMFGRSASEKRSISEKEPGLEVSSQLSGMDAGAEVLQTTQRKSVKELEEEALRKQKELAQSRERSKKLAKNTSLGFFGTTPSTSKLGTNDE
eukprot:CAMPEP_0182452366 /NCGR_PEP_ID=MMETSP1172-20130603/44211_1 /TAXON_ID=708627 /ORGANISM="Timspurckia oligopyrenoides, Strain CCMP3278" /LENGTH=971 /DNA_ID=CAMNT_0024650195 /DNA_START=110 /DNA_END=3025 /DNA_ORIENTATION=+